jgi:hypothetical protein
VSGIAGGGLCKVGIVGRSGSDECVGGRSGLEAG